LPWYIILIKNLTVWKWLEVWTLYYFYSSYSSFSSSSYPLELLAVEISLGEEDETEEDLASEEGEEDLTGDDGEGST
jgi:hypothetical protein